MKKLFIAIITTIFFCCKTENNKNSLDKTVTGYPTDSIIDPIEYPAEFKYGLDSIRKLVYSNMNLTDKKGTVWVSIIIDSLGNMGKPKVVKSENSKLNSEALRLARLIPNNWSPSEIGPERTKIPSKKLFSIKFDRAVKNLYSK